MILMHKFILNIQTLDERNFDIFGEDSQQIEQEWNKYKQANAFPVMCLLTNLSPYHKYKIVEWGMKDTTYKVEELIVALSKFTKFLKENCNKHCDYPTKATSSLVSRAKRKISWGKDSS